ncbi:MAG: CoA-binding protein [bacterium]
MEARLKESLNAIFKPRSVAIIGASNNVNRWGYSTVRNMLLAGYRHGLYPINPNESEIQGIKCYARLDDVPEPVDLAIIVVNTSLISDVIDDCAKNKVKGGIVITAGFAEISSEGAALQEKLTQKSKAAGFHFIGPNCWGIWSSEGNVNTVFGKDMQFRKGPITFLSQSGTLGEYFYNGAAENGFGASKFISCGNQSCIEFNDLLEYLGDDPTTEVIAAYVEDVKDGRRFLNIARAITPHKPILLFKAGSSDASARAVKSHTASMAGNDRVFDAACRQAGVLRFDDFMEMFRVAYALCYQPLPKSNRIGVISPGGGFCVTTAEICSKMGMELPEMSPEAQKQLLAQMTDFAPPPLNPIDSIGRKHMSAYQEIIEIVAGQDYIDGIIMTPRITQFERRLRPDKMVRGIELAERAALVPEKFGIPMICANEHELAGPMFEIYKRHNIPFYDNPMDCAKVMKGLVAYGTWKRKWQAQQA